MRHCYLLATVASDRGSLEITSAGFFSESYDTVTHDLHHTTMVEVARAEGPDYEEALQAMIAACQAQLKLEQQWGVTTIRGTIYALALEHHSGVRR